MVELYFGEKLEISSWFYGFYEEIYHCTQLEVKFCPSDLYIGIEKVIIEKKDKRL